MIRPGIGEVVGLIYVECLCGNWCAKGESAAFPICGACGRRMVVGGGGRDQFGPAPGSPDYDSHFGRRNRSLGFVAFMTNEIEAFTLIGRVKQFLGLNTARFALDATSRDAGPHFTDSEKRAFIDQRGWPVDRVWDGPPPWERPYVRVDTDDGSIARGEWLLPPMSPDEPVDPRTMVGKD